jgi:hypothetical protein
MYRQNLDSNKLIWLHNNKQHYFNNNDSPSVAKSENNQVLITDLAPQVQPDEFTELGIYVPTVISSRPVDEDRHPLSLEVSFLDLIEGASKSEIRLPIKFDLTTSAEYVKPQIHIDRNAPSSSIVLPVGIELSSAREQHIKRVNSLLWLGALAANEAAKQPALLPHRPKSVPIDSTNSILDRGERMLAVSFMLLGPDFFAPSGEVKDTVARIACLCFMTGTGIKAKSLLLGRQLRSLPAKNKIQPESKADEIDHLAHRLLSDRKLKKNASRLAKDYPVLLPNIAELT